VSWLLLLLLACPGKRAERAVEAMEREPASPYEPIASPVPAGPWEGRGLSVVVPPEWSGLAYGPDEPIALVVGHPSGVSVQIATWPVQPSLVPRPRPGCEPLWSDPGAWRVVPGLPVSLVAACVIDDSGQVVEGYYAVMGDQEVHVEVIYAPGRVIEGRARAEALLATLRRTQPVGIAPF
jgi:hypothetical protein